MLVKISGSDFKSKYYGEGENKAKRILALCRDLAARRGYPVLAFMDEIDGLGRQRSEGENSANDSLVAEVLDQVRAIPFCPASIFFPKLTLSSS